MSEMRIGHGFDVHALVADRKLIIGGVELEFEKGLAGHSDADVLLHAIADAILGAVGLADIGQQFPPTDEAYLNADSTELLRQVMEKAEAAGLLHLQNIDCVVMAERPMLNPHIPSMKAKIAAILKLDEARVGLKATTTEKLGFVGREEGIAASAVCLVVVK